MKKRIFIVLFVLIAAALFFAGHIWLEHKSNNLACGHDGLNPEPNLQAPIEFMSDNIILYPGITDNNKPSIYFFYVDWCTFCRRFLPVFEEFADNYKDKFNFVAINCDNPDNGKIVEEYHIMGFPSLFIYDEKLNHKFSLNSASVANKNIMEEELNNYLAFREKLNFI